MADTIARLEDIDVRFPVTYDRRQRAMTAIAGLSLEIHRGETLAIVGESGSGKSTLGKALLRLIDVSAGRVILADRDITDLGESELRPLRRHMQMIFQDPYLSLNPRKKVRSILADALALHGKREWTPETLMQAVGLPPSALDRRPSAFSGGQRQRIGIARALAVSPELIVADEPVSALDVSIRTQIIDLMQDLQRRLGLTYVFISHDLGVVRQIADRIAVFYLGRLMEIGGGEIVSARPAHPYTRALIDAAPIPDPAVRRKRTLLAGDPPSPLDPPLGCVFHTRCPRADETCRRIVPELREIDEGRSVACHHPLEPPPAA